MKFKELREKYKSKYPAALVAAAVKIAIDMGGAMTPAVKKIEAMKRGLSDDPIVKDALRQANESVNEETIEEALGNKNPSHRDKLKLDKDGTVHNLPGKKMGSAYSIKPRIDGGVLKFGTVDNEGNINTMSLKDLAKVVK